MTVEEIILLIVKILAGTGVFLVGVDLLTNNIEELATNNIKSLFNKTANKKLINVGIGAATTAIIQSSGVTTVLIVGFVNVGVMSLYQATAMIMGANIGTTITAHIAALSALKFTTYFQLFAFVGVLMALLTKKEKIKKVGFIIAGLGLIFIGLSLMSSAMKSYQAPIQQLLEQIQNPFLLFVMGIVLTAIVQSSSATTSIIIAMASTGLTIGTGGNEVLFFVLGTNIGSCVTAIMSSIGTNANAKRASLIHLLFNCFGAIIFFIFLSCYKNFMHDTLQVWFNGLPATQIAMFHTMFNVICTIIFLPFIKLFVFLSTKIIPDKKDKKKEIFFDERMLLSPMIALDGVKKEVINLAEKSFNLFLFSYNSFIENKPSNNSKIKEEEEKIEEYSQEITDYLIKVSANCKLINEETEVSNMHKNIGDILRIAEIADNFTKYTDKVKSNQIEFSDEVIVDLNRMKQELCELYNNVKEYMQTKNKRLLTQIDTLEENVDIMRKNNIDAHIIRLNSGTCKPKSSEIFINLVSNMERVGDHLTYIANAKQ